MLPWLFRRIALFPGGGKGVDELLLMPLKGGLECSRLAETSTAISNHLIRRCHSQGRGLETEVEEMDFPSVLIHLSFNIADHPLIFFGIGYHLVLKGRAQTTHLCSDVHALLSLPSTKSGDDADRSWWKAIVSEEVDFGLSFPCFLVHSHLSRVGRF